MAQDTLIERTLVDLLQLTPGHNTAIILPELGTRITYDSLRQQVFAMAEALLGPGSAGWIVSRSSCPTACPPS